VTTVWIDISGRAFTLAALVVVLVILVQIATPWFSIRKLTQEVRQLRSDLKLDDFDSYEDDDEEFDDDEFEGDAWDRGHDEWMDRAVGL
jgi:hypothetical protein